MTVNTSANSSGLAKIDWPVVVNAAGAGLLVVIPAALLTALVFSDTSTSRWAILFSLVIFLGFAVAGFGAGRLRRDTPMIHGALAALLCYVVVQGFGIARRLVADKPLNLATYPLSALLAACLGVAGALFADWYLRRNGSQGS